ncbi:hypothetical protein CHIBA101_0207 [Actinomyces sp. Chiba101]|nr:hypothetical protein CHIBA101_0207 [Actinomyces sp. Chiba101]GAV94986.1 hypothetical protein ADENT20671_1763 [Actinomyces denticolens]SUU11507.1 Uncharacterised protein [Actinomyces denticolens]
MTARARRTAGGPLGTLRRWGTLIGGGASHRSRAIETSRAIRRPLPLTGRILVAPTAPRAGATTVALLLSSLIARERRRPGLLISASTGPRSAADLLPYSTDIADMPAARAPRTVAQTIEALGSGPDGLLSCLRLSEEAHDPDALMRSWTRAQHDYLRFFDTAVTETGTAEALGPALLDLHGRHHSTILVSPAQRTDMERGRELAARLLADARGKRGALLHVVVATRPGYPLVPEPGTGESLVPFDHSLAGNGDSVPAPGLLDPLTSRVIADVAATSISGCIAALSRRSRRALASGNGLSDRDWLLPAFGRVSP